MSTLPTTAIPTNGPALSTSENGNTPPLTKTAKPLSLWQKIRLGGIALSTGIAVLLLVAAVLLLFQYQLRVGAAVADQAEQYQQRTTAAMAALNNLDPTNKDTVVVRQYELERQLAYNKHTFHMVVSAQLASASLGQTTCGLFVALVVFFLGVALLLFNAPGNIDASIESEQLKMSIFRLGPGTLCFVLAAVIIGLTLWNRPKLEIDPDSFKSYRPVYTVPSELP